MGRRPWTCRPPRAADSSFAASRLGSLRWNLMNQRPLPASASATTFAHFTVFMFASVSSSSHASGRGDTIPSTRVLRNLAGGVTGKAKESEGRGTPRMKRVNVPSSAYRGARGKCGGVEFHDGLQDFVRCGLLRHMKVTPPPPPEPVYCSACRLERGVPRLHVAPSPPPGVRARSKTSRTRRTVG